MQHTLTEWRGFRQYCKIEAIRQRQTILQSTLCLALTCTFNRLNSHRSQTSFWLHFLANFWLRADVERRALVARHKESVGLNWKFMAVEGGVKKCAEDRLWEKEKKTQLLHNFFILVYLKKDC